MSGPLTGLDPVPRARLRRGSKVAEDRAATRRGRLDTVQMASYTRAPSTAAGPCTTGRRWRTVLRAIALFALGIVLLDSSNVHAQNAMTHKGVVLPNGSVRVAEGRFRLPDGYDATMKWLKTAYKADKYPRKFIVNQPGVKGIHVVNPTVTEEWEGFNLYEHQGEVRLYVLLRQAR